MPVSQDRRRTILSLLAASVLLYAPQSRSEAADEPKVIEAAEARKHIDETCTVAMTVRSSKDAAPRREYYLDSEPDFRDERNLAVVISYDHADRFREAGINDPAAHYRDKAVRVTGKIIHEADQVRIRVEDPKHIVIADDSSR